jgi:hypothetical protein
LKSALTVIFQFSAPSAGLGYNLVGSFPFELSLLSNLEVILIDNNENFVGPIPESWSPRLSNLKNFFLSGNKHTGTFPDFLLLDNPMLGTINIENNMFGGALPSSLSSPSLQSLRLGNNLFNGTIPPEIANVTNLGK